MPRKKYSWAVEKPLYTEKKTRHPIHGQLPLKEIKSKGMYDKRANNPWACSNVY